MYFNCRWYIYVRKKDKEAVGFFVIKKLDRGAFYSDPLVIS
jgi:hypothetical protein